MMTDFLSTLGFDRRSQLALIFPVCTAFAPLSPLKNFFYKWETLFYETEVQRVVDFFVGALDFLVGNMKKESVTKMISLEKAKRLIQGNIDECVRGDNREEIENFWIKELGELSLNRIDVATFERIRELRDKDLGKYEHCVRSGVVSWLLRKNWRHFLNNGIIEKYDDYTSNKNSIKTGGGLRTVKIGLL